MILHFSTKGIYSKCICCVITIIFVVIQSYWDCFFKLQFRCFNDQQNQFSGSWLADFLKRNRLDKNKTCKCLSLVAQMVKNLLAMQETWVWSLGREDPWRRQWLPTPVFLPGEFHGQSMGSQRVRHNRVTNTFHFHAVAVDINSWNIWLL